jgi:hypothetical protein
MLCPCSAGRLTAGRENCASVATENSSATSTVSLGSIAAFRCLREFDELSNVRSSGTSTIMRCRGEGLLSAQFSAKMRLGGD